MTMIPELPLPGNWSRTTLADVRRDNTTTLNPAKYPDERFELYSIPAHETGKPERAKGREIGSAKKTLSPDTVLLSKINPRINRVWVVGDSSDLRQIGSSEWIAFCPIEGVVPQYLAHYLRQDRFCTYLASNVSGVGGSLMRVKESVVDPFPFALPSSREQQRIVEAIDSYLTRLDDAVASLERVQAKLTAYHASVLKAAMEGRLVPTEASLALAEKRACEPAEALLSRILKERRRRWEEAELSKLNAAGKPPKNDKWKAKYQEPAAPDTSMLPGLPPGWCWASVGQLGLVSGGLTQNANRERHKTKLPFLRVANVYANALVLDKIKMIGVEPGEMESARLSTGDLLVVEGNGSVDQIGRVALWDGSIEPILHQNHLIKVRCESRQLSKWILGWLLSPAGRAAIEHVASSTSGLHTLSISKVSRLVVPLPPVAEQIRASDAIDATLSIVDATDDGVLRDLRRCSRLRQAVLKWAFEGRLVDQDPADESADKLLARIRAERVTAVTIKKSRGRLAKGAA